MIHIQEPKSPWEVVHMDWVIELPPSGDKRYNACLVIVDRYSKTPIFLPCHKDDTAMDTAFLLRSRGISHTELFKNIIRDRDPKLKSALWTNLHKLFGTKLSFYTAHHPQKDGLAERMIQTLEDMCHNHGNPPSWTSLWHIHAISNIWKFGHIHNHWPNWPLSCFMALMVILSSGANLAPSPSSSHSRLSLCFWVSWVFSIQQGKYSPKACIWLFKL
ncbi:hypothetical protein O181_073023 [Austropuccinia psidii MF-1]|uniref:Integrase catalytic domain-containing protein n=1 Tax=Austropuccinia psidii MF-1 TaxID=1389203 RepID=A0A9Q3F8C2_9BASI|nr:hypothetical protein [Austropuccinia psidii MF-1]